MINTLLIIINTNIKKEKYFKKKNKVKLTNLFRV